MPESSTQSNKTSKSRKALLKAFKKYIKDFQPGDQVIYFNLPAHKQGLIAYEHVGISAAQAEAVLRAVQQGMISRGHPDPRLAEVLELVSAHRAAEEAVAGDGDQSPSTRPAHAGWPNSLLCCPYTVCGTTSLD